MTTITYHSPASFAIHQRAILDAVHRSGTTNKFILKDSVVRLENEIAELTGASNAVAVGSGSGALTVALTAVGVRPDTEVIVPAYCFPSVAATVMNIGAVPMFVDVDPWTMVMDPDLVTERITAQTRAIVPAHMYSVMADMEAIASIARKTGLAVVEDSATALGAHLGGRAAGLWGDVGIYSFYPVKPLGGVCEAGMIVTDDDQVARTCRMLRNHGQDGVTRFLHHTVGYNFRMDEIAAEVILHRLHRAELLIARRAELAARYAEGLNPISDKISLPPTGAIGSVFYVYAIKTDRRDALRRYLGHHGIETFIHCPKPLFEHPAFARFAPPPGEMPNARRVAKTTLALPLYPELENAAVDHVIATILQFYD